MPMTVLRRLDVVLEDTMQVVLDIKAMLDKEGFVEQRLVLRHVANQTFYSTTKFTMRDIRT